METEDNYSEGIKPQTTLMCSHNNKSFWHDCENSCKPVKCIIDTDVIDCVHACKCSGCFSFTLLNNVSITLTCLEREPRSSWPVCGWPLSSLLGACYTWWSSARPTCLTERDSSFPPHLFNLHWYIRCYIYMRPPLFYLIHLIHIYR